MTTLRQLLIAALLSIAFTGSIQAASLVFMIGEDEYHTWETLPEFAQKDLEPLGHRVTIIHADATDKNNFPGLVAALRDADLLLVSVRRRTPHKEQLDAVRAHLAAGKPLVGIRTASHAFALKTPLTDPSLGTWPEFDPEVLGGHYEGHGKGAGQTVLTLAPGAEAHPILRGVTVAKLLGHGTLYRNTPLEKNTTPLLIGTITGEPAQPVAWTHRYGPKQARIFYTSLGHPGDFQNAEFRRLLANGVVWALEK